MKSCPSCRRLYPDDASFCPIDGMELKRATEVPAVQDDQDPRLGRVLGARYQMRRVVADGGMGRVYEALDIQERKRVALKVLHPTVAQDKVAIERFHREYEVSKLLPHEHIAEVFDFLRLEDGSYALVMDYLEGEELRSLLKRERTMRPERVVRMLSQLAIGLDEAHRRQLIHRDLKPDNIFLCGTTEGDIVKLLDFGSVKDKSEGAKKLTVMGTTIGSPYYMSPEQAQGLDTLDARADVWALAAIAYEALTTEVPFKGRHGPSILLAILTQDPDPASAAAERSAAGAVIPATVDRVLDRAFVKDPAFRIGSVGALADELGAAFGLGGTHQDWAYEAEQALGENIRAALPTLLDASASLTAAAEADPFASAPGEGSPEGTVDTAQMVAAAAPKPIPVVLIMLVSVAVVSLLAGVIVLLMLR